MSHPPLWLWLFAIALTLLGIWFSSAFDKLLARLPLWLFWLLVLALGLGVWLLLSVQFSHLTFRFSFPLCVFFIC